MKDYPIVDYPTVIEGVVHGDMLRLESLDGSEMFATIDDLKNAPGCFRERSAFVLRNFGPIQFGTKTWGVTHLQKKSRRGWLKMSPACYHSWNFLRMQKQKPDGSWIPGSELGLYIRKGLGGIFDWSCWRWDIAGTLVDGVLRHWITSTGFLGGHWD